MIFIYVSSYCALRNVLERHAFLAQNVRIPKACPQASPCVPHSRSVVLVGTNAAWWTWLNKDRLWRARLTLLVFFFGIATPCWSAARFAPGGCRWLGSASTSCCIAVPQTVITLAVSGSHVSLNLNLSFRSDFVLTALNSTRTCFRASNQCCGARPKIKGCDLFWAVVRGFRINPKWNVAQVMFSVPALGWF